MARPLRLAGAVVLALLVGLAGLAVVFTDIGPGEAGAARVLTGALLFFFGGLAVGLLAPGGRGWLLAGLCAWSLLLLGGMGVWMSITSPASGDPALAILFLLGPLVASLAGGGLGARIRRRPEAGRRDGRGTGGTVPGVGA